MNKPVLCLASDYESSESDFFPADGNVQNDMQSEDSFLRMNNEGNFPQSQHSNNDLQFLRQMQLDYRVAKVAEAEPNQLVCE